MASKQICLVGGSFGSGMSGSPFVGGFGGGSGSFGGGGGKPQKPKGNQEKKPKPAPAVFGDLKKVF